MVLLHVNTGVLPEDLTSLRTHFTPRPPDPCLAKPLHYSKYVRSYIRSLLSLTKLKHTAELLERCHAA